MNRVRALDAANATITVEAGMPLAAVQDAATAAGFDRHFIKPADTREDWDDTDLWRTAADIPGENIVMSHCCMDRAS